MSGVVTSLPGASVTLTCPGGEPEDNGTVQWLLQNLVDDSYLGSRAAVGRTLLLRSVQLSDSGNYSCYQDGRLAGTVRLLVDGELCAQSAGRQVPDVLETLLFPWPDKFWERSTGLCQRGRWEAPLGGGIWLTWPLPALA